MSITTFLGRGWGFPPRFVRPEAGVDMADGEALIKQSIYLALHTLLGERPYWPQYGSGLGSFGFEAASIEVLVDLKEEIASVLLNYEPRIKLEDIEFGTDDLINGVLDIGLVYLVKETNSRNNMVFPFYLTEQSV